MCNAVPLPWRGDVIGALNLLFAAKASPTHADVQVFADLATVAIMHAAPLTAPQVLARTRSALDERTIIEQAKGVLAQQHHLAMDAAYELMLATARDRGELLTVTAAALVRRASTRLPD